MASPHIKVSIHCETCNSGVELKPSDIVISKDQPGSIVVAAAKCTVGHEVVVRHIDGAITPSGQSVVEYLVNAGAMNLLQKEEVITVGS